MCSSQLAFVGGVLNATWNLPGNPGAPAWFRAVGSLGASASNAVYAGAGVALGRHRRRTGAGAGSATGAGRGAGAGAGAGIGPVTVTAPDPFHSLLQN